MPHKNDFRGSIESLDKCLHGKRSIIFLKHSIAENESLKNGQKCKMALFQNMKKKRNFTTLTSLTRGATHPGGESPGRGVSHPGGG